jgi:hypothetical protein
MVDVLKKVSFLEELCASRFFISDLLRKSFLASLTPCLSAVPKDSFWTYAAGLS